MIYLTLFIEFFKVGLFSFGGGFGMIPLIQDAVIRHNWMSEDAFYNFIGVCESTPGPIAVNMATYVGSTQAGLPGGIVATLGVITPSFFIILLIAAVIKNLTKNTYVQGFLYGIKPVILALILATGINMLLKSTGYVSLSEYDVNIPAIIILFLHPAQMEAEAVSDLSDPAFRGSGNRGIRDCRTHQIKSHLIQCKVSGDFIFFIGSHNYPFISDCSAFYFR